MFTVAPHCQIMAQLNLKDSSHNLHVIGVIGFFFLHLIFNACVQINILFDSVKIFIFETKHGLTLLLNLI